MGSSNPEDDKNLWTEHKAKNGNFLFIYYI